MNDNELINTAVSGFTPYQFEPLGNQSLQVMPTAFDRTAVRAEKRISDTQKRVNDLVKLDPTNPLAAFITMMGANQNNDLRQELMGLRGQAMGSSMKGKKREKLLKDIKAMGLDDALGIYARKNHGGDLDSALGDSNLMSGLEKIKTTPVPLDYKEQGKLLDQMYKVKASLEIYEDLGKGISKADEQTKGHYERWLAHANRLLGGSTMSPLDYQNFRDDPLINKAPPPTTTKKVVDNPNTIVDESKEAKGDSVVARKKKGIAILQGEKIPGLDPLTQEPTGLSGIYNDGKRLIQDNVIEPIGKSVLGPEGQVRKDLKGTTIKGINWLFDELPQELTDQGWTKEQMRLNPSKGKVKVGDQLPEMRDVFYNNNTGVYVSERGGQEQPFIVGDPVNGVQKSFKTQAEAFAWASTYIPKPAKVAKKLSSKEMDAIGSGATGSADFTIGSPQDAQVQAWNEEQRRIRQANIPPVISKDARTEEEKNTKPWQRTWVGGYLDKGLEKIKDLHEYMKFNPDLKYGTEALEDLKELYDAGAAKVGADGWSYVLDMMKDAGKWIITPSNAEGATLDGTTEMGSGNNINAGGSNVGGVGKAGKRYGGFAGQNPIAVSTEQFLSDPFVGAMVTAESNGKERAIGYKLVEEKDSGKLVYAKDKSGKKIPASYGLMQVTIPTALSTKWGKELLNGLNPKAKEDREEIKRILFDPYNNLRISTEFANRLRDQLSKNKYASKFSPLEFDQLVSAAYNYKGENFVKDVIDKYKPTNIRDLLHRAYIPKETRRQIRVVGQVLSKGGR